jgi:transcriptional regulator with XRE-family HTH domain
MSFRDNLKMTLDERGMLVKELAAKSGIKKSSLDNYLNTRGQLPSVDKAVKIARVLGVSVEFLVLGWEPQLKSLNYYTNRHIRGLLNALEKLTNDEQQLVLENALNLAGSLIKRR